MASKPISPSIEKPPIQKSTTSSNPDIKEANTKESQKVDPPPIQSNVPVQNKVKPKGINKINVDIDSLLHQVKKESQAIQSIEVDWNLENLQNVFNEYIEKQESQSTQQSLRQMILEIDGTKVNMTFPTTLSMSSVKQETSLLEQIRNTFINREIEYNFKVDLDRFPELKELKKETKILSNADRYEAMRKKNPALDEFIKTFELKIS